MSATATKRSATKTSGNKRAAPKRRDVPSVGHSVKARKRGAAIAAVDSELGDVLRVPVEPHQFIFDAYATDATPQMADRRTAERQLERQLRPQLGELHDRMMAAKQHSMLVVLQGLDASGKSGTIKHVGTAFNPCAMSVANFKQPDATEQQQHFLTRIRAGLPDPGSITFFDRSHYEDAIAPRSLCELDEGALMNRVAEIEAFERELVAGGTTVVKILLHLGYDEQRSRFLRRLDRPDKQWKFSEADLATRANWQAVEAAYGEVIGNASFDVAPWYVVPSDHKWYRNWAVAQLLVDHLKAQHDAYPTIDNDVKALSARLRPPF